ncbi:hypothetical protein FRC02_000464 [Tulasnella sp. 418]|nr:hypothetical protein FRC02_000464 [Tulasnella sp. 418]
MVVTRVWLIIATLLLARKFLLPSSSYTLGRAKDSNIIIPLKSISNKNSRFDVGEHTLEDSSNIESIPTLKYTQISTSKSGILRRGDEEPVVIQKESSVELQDGDFVHLTGAEYGISVHWVPLNIFLTSRGGLDSDFRADASRKLAKLGIKCSKEWSPSVTHLVFKSAKSPYNFRILSALVTQSQIVTPKWIEELIQAFAVAPGTPVDIPDSVIQLDHNGAASGKLELDTLLKLDISKIVDEEKFRPPGLLGKGWAPENNRSKLLDGLRFLILAADGVAEGLLDVIKYGGGEFRTQTIKDEPMNVDEWSTKLRALRRKPDRNNERTGMTCGLVLIGDTAELSSALGSQWDDVYLAGIQSQGLRIIWLAELSECLLRKDLKFIDCGKPDPNQLEDQQQEPKTTAPPLRRRTTRASSREPSQPPPGAIPPSTFPDEPSLQGSRKGSKISQEPSTSQPKRQTRSVPTPAPEQNNEVDAPEEQEPQPQKTTLRRRVTTRKKEPSPAPQTVSRAASEDVQIIDPPSEPSVSRPLKRRVTAKPGTQKDTSRSQSVEMDDSPPVAQVEPPHKKFKFLFEGTQAPMDSIPEDSESHPVERSSTVGIANAAELPNSPASGRSKRKATQEGSLEDSLPISKKRATQDRLSVEPPGVSRETSLPPASQRPTQVESQYAKSHSQSKAASSTSTKAFKAKTQNSGTVPDNITEKAPDTEPAFLQAMASRTKSKRKEDDFDREFNQLRIAVPEKQDYDLEEQRRRELEAWSSLDLDVNIRGNFMVVEYRDLIRKDQRRRNEPAKTYGQDVPNFKKFKKKQSGPRSAKVELFLPETVDFGMGDAYWQQDQSAIMGSGSTGVMPITQPSQPSAKPRVNVQRRRVQLTIDTDDESSGNQDDEVLPPKRSSRKAGATGTAKRQIPSKSSKAVTARSRPKAKPNFSFDDDDDDEVALPEEESEIFDMNVSGDEDDRLTSTLKSSENVELGQRNGTNRGSQMSTASKRRHKVLEDSDSDPDSLTFAAFKRNRLKR